MWLFKGHAHTGDQVWFRTNEESENHKADSGSRRIDSHLKYYPTEQYSSKRRDNIWSFTTNTIMLFLVFTNNVILLEIPNLWKCTSNQICYVPVMEYS